MSYLVSWAFRIIWVFWGSAAYIKLGQSY